MDAAIAAPLLLLMEIVRLKGNLFQAKDKLFQAFCANMDDTILVLESSMHEEESAACHKQAVVVVEVGMDDDVRDARFVFQAEEDKAKSRAWALASDDRTCMSDIALIRSGVKFCLRKDACGSQLITPEAT